MQGCPHDARGPSFPVRVEGLAARHGECANGRGDVSSSARNLFEEKRTHRTRKAAASAQAPWAVSGPFPSTAASRSGIPATCLSEDRQFTPSSQTYPVPTSGWAGKCGRASVGRIGRLGKTHSSQAMRKPAYRSPPLLPAHSVLLCSSTATIPRKAGRRGSVPDPPEFRQAVEDPRRLPPMTLRAGLHEATGWWIGWGALEKWLGAAPRLSVRIVLAEVPARVPELVTSIPWLPGGIAKSRLSGAFSLDRMK